MQSISETSPSEHTNVRFVRSLRYSSPSHFVSLFFFHFAFDVVVVLLLFYVHGKHLRSCRDDQLN